MTKLTTDEVLKLARLARLKLSEEEVSQFKNEISTILGYVEQLQSISVDGIEPTYQVNGLTNVTRPDEVYNYGSSPEDLLKNAPAVEKGQFKTKRILDQ